MALDREGVATATNAGIAISSFWEVDNAEDHSEERVCVSPSVVVAKDLSRVMEDSQSKTM